MDQTFINYLYAGFYQLGFVTKDLDKAQKFFTEELGAVPKFMVLNNPEVKNQTYRGEPVEIEVNLAFGQWGNTNIEVIQPTKGRSTYNEKLDGYDWIGLHHVAIKVFDFDKTISDLTAKGVEIAQTGEVGTGTRFHYMDYTKQFNYFLEVLYFDPEFEKLFDKIRRGDL